MAGVFGCHYDLGNVQNTAYGQGTEINIIQEMFLSKYNFRRVLQQLHDMGLGDPDWRSLSPYMRFVLRNHPGTFCMNQPLTHAYAARHVELLNRRVLEMVVPRIRSEINAWNGYLRDRQGLTLIDRPCSDGYKKRWTPVRLDRRLYWS